MKTKGSASEIDREIGQWIKSRRTSLGISQERLAGLIGLSFQQIQKYEHGVNRVSAATLSQIAKVLDVNISYFVPADEEKLTVFDISPEALEFARIYDAVKEPLLRDAVMTLIRRAEKVAP